VTVLQNISIISGGQTGADRAALDFAISHGFKYGGWCPKHRRAEDGAISSQYSLQETPSAHYSQRTQWNVRDSDATVVFSIRPRVSGGTRLTLELARRLEKPVLHLSRDDFGIPAAASRLKAFLQEHQVRRLNVAGPRISQESDIAPFVQQVLSIALCSSDSAAASRP
jgi:hypothetical protein